MCGVRNVRNYASPHKSLVSSLFYVCGCRVRRHSSAHARGSCAWESPSPKISPEYPRCGRSKNPAFSMACEKYPQYPQYPQYPRDVGDALSHARKTIFARLDVRPIECASEGRFWPSLCLWDKAASTDKSAKSTAIFGRRGCVVFTRAKVRAGKAHLVTICHRLREWPFFRVFGGRRRFDGFPFGLHRNAPKRAFFGRSRRCHRIDRCSAHAWVSCAWKSRVPV